jgi:hypothetical protein
VWSREYADANESSPAGYRTALGGVIRSRVITAEEEKRLGGPAPDGEGDGARELVELGLERGRLGRVEGVQGEREAGAGVGGGEVELQETSATRWEEMVRRG